MGTDSVFVFVGTYPDTQSAESDYDLVKELHSAGAVGTYDAAVVGKDEQGKAHVHKHEKPTQHGAWSGLGVGALLGILFPPRDHRERHRRCGRRGPYRPPVAGDVARGSQGAREALDDGEAALVVVGRDKLEETLNKELKRAAKTYEKEIDAYAAEFRRELDKAIDEVKM